MSHDDTRAAERTSALALASELAHVHNTSLRMTIRALARETRSPDPAGVYGAYLNALVLLMSTSLGRDATTGVLRQVLETHVSGKNDHAESNKPR